MEILIKLGKETETAPVIVHVEHATVHATPATVHAAYATADRHAYVLERAQTAKEQN